mgnify:FL=1
MDTALEVYQPVNTSLNLTTGISVFLLLAALLGLYWNEMREVAYDNRHYRQLGLVLFGFLALLSAIAALFSGLTSRRIGPVEFYADRIETVEATIPYRSIQRAYLHQDQPQSSFGSSQARGDTTLMLIIVERLDQKTHVFSAYNYPIERLHNSLKQHLEAARKPQ